MRKRSCPRASRSGVDGSGEVARSAPARVLALVEGAVLAQLAAGDRARHRLLHRGPVVEEAALGLGQVLGLVVHARVHVHRRTARGAAAAGRGRRGDRGERDRGEALTHARDRPLPPPPRHRRGQGAGLRSRTWYVVRGRVLSSARRAYERSLARARATSLFSSSRSPKWMASAGQACWQAVRASPSRISRPARRVADPRRVEPLHAVGALLHDAAGADRDVGVLGHPDELGGVLRVVEEVEAPDLVGAVVRAVAGADAPVVDHHVQALAVVHGGRDRAHLLARRVLALHAGHRLEHRPRLRRLAGEVAVDPEPGHLAAAAHLVAADDRHVVLALARHRARVAAGARVEVDDHAPLRPLLVLRRREELRDLGALGRGARLLAELRERREADESATLHAAVLLGLRERLAPPGRGQARVGGEVRPARRAQGVGVVADAVADAAGGAAAVAEVEDAACRRPCPAPGRRGARAIGRRTRAARRRRPSGRGSPPPSGSGAAGFPRSRA